jgi:hypothetical protein
MTGFNAEDWNFLIIFVSTIEGVMIINLTMVLLFPGYLNPE